MEPAELYAELGEAIAARRKRLGFTQAFLAQRMGMPRATLANIEVGRQRLLVHQLYAFADALELEPQHLLPVRKPSKDSESLPITDADLTAKQRAQIESLFGTTSGSRRND